MPLPASKSEDILIWFNSAQNGGRRDPIDFAQEWFCGKAERQKAIESRKKDVKEKGEAAVNQEHKDEATLNGDSQTTESPPQARSGIQSDALAAGVYPTPPDGMGAPVVRDPGSEDALGSTPGLTSEQNILEARDDATGALATAEELAVGASDMYGDDDDEFFEEPDFSYFDEPDFLESMGGQLDATTQVSTHTQIDEDSQARSIDVEMISPEEIVGNQSANLVTASTSTIPSEANEATQSGEELNENRASVSHTMEKHDSPFTPGKIMSHLLPDSSLPEDSGHQKHGEDYSQRQTSHIHSLHKAFSNKFDTIGLNDSLRSSDEKYMKSGKFGLAEMQPNVRSLHSDLETNNVESRIPSIGTRWRALDTKSSLQSNGQFSASIGGFDAPDLKVIGLDTPEGSDSESVISSSESDGDESSHTDRENLSHSLREVARSKRSGATNNKSAHKATAVLLETEPANESSPIDRKHSSLLKKTPLYDDEKGAQLPSHTMELGLGTTERVTVGQIVTDQLTSASCATNLEFPFDKESLMDRSPSQIHLTGNHNYANDSMSSFTSLSIEDTEMKDVYDWEARHDVGNNVDTMEIRKIDSPHIRVRRAQDVLEVLPLALSQWEAFGLSPLSGSKNASAICIIPPGDGVNEAAEAFMSRICNTYRNCRLGDHAMTQIDKITDSGIIRIGAVSRSSGWVNKQNIVGTMAKECLSIGAHLAHKRELSPNLVVYMVNPFSEDQSLYHISMAFHRLINAFGRVRGERPSVDIVLKILPLSSLVSVSSPVVVTQSVVTETAFDIYDRCRQTQSEHCLSKADAIAPRLIISTPGPEFVNLRLATQGSYSPMHDFSCMHLAYARSPDDEWISVAWTDDWGKVQCTASYYCGRKATTEIRNFSEVAEEVWQTTLDLVRYRPIRWRLLVVKVGALDREDVTTWTALADAPKSAWMNLTLLSADVEAKQMSKDVLDRLDAHIKAEATLPDTTPVSTPLSNIHSPDDVSDSGTPVTSGANVTTPTDSPWETDVDATLVDSDDRVWAAVLPAATSSSIGEDQDEILPLATGWMVQKRSSSTATDGPGALEIEVRLALKSGIRSLMGIMEKYRGLGTLAQLKGALSPTQNLMPWHIAVVLRMRERLQNIMWQQA